MVFAGWVNRYQLDVIDYLQEENRVLKKRLDRRCIHFTDAERRRVVRNYSTPQLDGQFFVTTAA